MPGAGAAEVPQGAGQVAGLKPWGIRDPESGIFMAVSVILVSFPSVP